MISEISRLFGTPIMLSETEVQEYKDGWCDNLPYFGELFSTESSLGREDYLVDPIFAFMTPETHLYLVGSVLIRMEFLRMAMEICEHFEGLDAWYNIIWSYFMTIEVRESAEFHELFELFSAEQRDVWKKVTSIYLSTYSKFNKDLKFYSTLEGKVNSLV